MKNLIQNKSGMTLSGVILILLFSVTSISAQEASFKFFPNAVEVYEGESFETQVLIETGNVPFTVFDLHLAFDTEFLQVTEVEVIQEGAFNYHIPAEFSNNTGRIDAAAFKTSEEMASESLALVNITFAAVTPTELTEVNHVINEFPRSIIAYGGESVLGEAGGLSVTIIGNALSDGIGSGENEFDLKIWPNPSKDIAQVSFEMLEEGQISLEILSLEGKLINRIFEGNAQGKTPYQFEVNVNNLAAGNYTCRLMNADGATVAKTLTVVK